MTASTIVTGMTIDSTSFVLSPGNVIQPSSAVPTLVADTNYSALNTDGIIAYTSLTASRTVTLTPCGSPGMLKYWCIKDLSGNCSTTNKIILASTSGTFDGLGSTAISTPCGSKTFRDNGTNFFMVGAFVPSVNGSSLIQKADGNGGLLDAIDGTDFMSPALSMKAYYAATFKATPILYANTATVASGIATFQLTTNGLSTGTSVFPNGMYAPSLNLFVNDATSSYQMSYALTNGNKTLTVTANKLGTANLITGILGQLPANGAVVNLTAWGS